jgi:type IV pilus assembly protein PilY1
MFGNLWRFDIDDNIAPAGKEATLLATLRGRVSTAYPAGNHQPITARPVLGNANGNAMVYVGTGRLLGISDLADNNMQSIYGIKDALGTAGYGNPRDDTAFIHQTIAGAACPTGSSGTVCASGQLVRTGTNLPVDLGTDKGWFIDLPDTGERANVDPALGLGTLAFNTNIPTSNACTAGGYSYTYFFNYLTGAPVTAASNGVVGVKLGNGLTSRPVLVESTTGKVVSINQVDGAGGVTSANGTTVYRPTQGTPPINVGSSGIKRVSWRELVD